MIGLLDRVTRSIERPSVPLSSGADELFEAFGGRRTDAGVSVTKTTALQHAPLWRGVNLISRSVGKLPFYVYQRNGEGKDKATKHPAYKLLRRKPNSLMTAFTFKQTLTAHVILQGNAYAYIQRRGDSRPVELLPLLPDRTYPVREDGKLLYITSVGGTLEDPQSSVRKILPENILHIKGLGYDGLVGYSLIEYGADAIGHGMAMEKYGSRYFRNNARPSVVIEHPGSISEPAAKRLRESWDQLYAGIENAHRTAILEEGMKINPMQINARDSQLIEARKMDLTTQANLLCLPPHKVGGDGRTSYNSLEMENQDYLDDSLDPWLVAIEEECQEKLLTEKEKEEDTHVVEFMRQALIRADMAARSTFYHNALQDGYMNRDEVRSRENLNPMPEDEGQKFFIPLNVKTTGDDDEASEVEDVQTTALNGAQIASMVQIGEQVSAGVIPKDSAKAMLKASFPMVSQSDIDGIIDPIEEGATKPEPPVEIPAPTTPGEPPKPDPIAERTLEVLGGLDSGFKVLAETISTAAEQAREDTKALIENASQHQQSTDRNLSKLESSTSALATSVGSLRETMEAEKRDEHLRLLSSTISRACRRIGAQARHAATNSKKFPVWLESFANEHRGVLLEMLSETVSVCCKRGKTERIVERILSEVRSKLDACYSTKGSKEFVAGVDECMTACETAFATSLAESFLNKETE